uniref:Uncharacterized protein n=1 Tax=Arundo donax TaxID=35708 RepID=A0A0A8Z779_ARUDO
MDPNYFPLLSVMEPCEETDTKSIWIID